MSFDADFRRFLIDDPGVGEIIGDRLYPLVLPQGCILPAATYQEISGTRDHTMDGPSGIASLRVQITTFAVEKKLAKELANRIRLALDGAYGLLGAGTSVQRIELLDAHDEYDSVVTVHSAVLDFEIEMEEPVRWAREA